MVDDLLSNAAIFFENRFHPKNPFRLFRVTKIQSDDMTVYFSFFFCCHGSSTFRHSRRILGVFSAFSGKKI
jgi:hypothetical protein